MINAVIEKICILQPKYSSRNTPDMQERGRLVRSELASAVRAEIPRLQAAFDSVFNDLYVDASDGIGRKTEAPWVRLYSRAMSPSPREGFYLVLHFAADGSGCFVTVGCGSTIWRGGDLRPLPDKDLSDRTSWARLVVIDSFGELAPFSDQMSLGAKAGLPKTFEKATAFAKRIPFEAVSSVDVIALLYLAAQRLNAVYRAQLDGRDMSPGEIGIQDVTAMLRPLGRRHGQGFQLSAGERRAVEIQAMSKAIEYLTALGFKCKDTSSTESFDILATTHFE